jgi:endonuclease/exonuclease/phosphatase family metal-dependent hydrolase
LTLPLLLFGACSPAVVPPDVALRLQTLNIANGAGDRFRTSEMRPRQAALIAEADLVALQEVDVGVVRSGNTNTALALGGLDDCAMAVAAPPHLSADGVMRCSSDAGTVLFGLGFRGNDVFSADDSGVPGGIIDGDPSLNPTSVDRSPEALFGNALVVRRARVESAVVVALPMDSAPPPLERYASLANGPLDEVAAHNLAIRFTPGIEPRSVLVVRVDRRALSVLATHLESGSQAALRAAQLNALVAIAKGEQAKARRVVLMGDLNMTPEEATPALSDAGFTHAVGTGADQVWVEAALSVSLPEDHPTEGASDHAFAPAATIR